MTVAEFIREIQTLDPDFDNRQILIEVDGEIKTPQLRFWPNAVVITPGE